MPKIENTSIPAREQSNTSNSTTTNNTGKAFDRSVTTPSSVKPLITHIKDYDVIPARVPADNLIDRQGVNLLISNSGLLPALPATQAENGDEPASESFIFSEPTSGQHHTHQKSRSVGHMPLVFIGTEDNLEALMVDSRDTWIENRLSIHNSDGEKPIYAGIFPYSDPKHSRKIIPHSDATKAVINGLVNFGVRTKYAPGSLAGSFGKGISSLITRAAKTGNISTKIPKKQKSGKEKNERLMLKISFEQEAGMTLVGHKKTTLRNIHHALLTEHFSEINPEQQSLADSGHGSDDGSNQ